MSKLVPSVNVSVTALSAFFYWYSVGSADDQPRLPVVEADWTVLDNDPSRADLFGLVALSKDLEDGLVPASHNATGFAVPAKFVFPADVRTDPATGNARVNSIFGIDLSHWNQLSFPLNNLSVNGIDFVYAKATQGTTYKDDHFATYWSTLQSQHFPRGAYHFLSSQVDGKAQAQSFVRYLKLHHAYDRTDSASELPPCLDLEWDVTTAGGVDRWRNVAPDQIISTVKAFLDEVKAQTGRTPVVYTARSWWIGRFGTDANFSALKGYKLWLADYSRSAQATEVPSRPAGFLENVWQFTGTARLQPGPAATFDADVFKGSKIDFENFAYRDNP